MDIGCVNKSDSDSDYEIIDNAYSSIPPEVYSCNQSYKYLTKQFSKQRICSISEESFDKFLDSDGRLVDEHKFRQAVFRGGINHKIRKTAWKYLFKMFPFHSTQRERNILLAEHHFKYRVMKLAWKNFCNEENSNECLVSTDYKSKDVYDDKFKNEMKGILKMNDKEVEVQLKWMDIQARLNLKNIHLDNEYFTKYTRIIDKDVPRTDRELDYFRGDSNPNLNVLKDILYTFIFYHPEVGYSQGMNEHVSRFLYVLDSEAEAYWCFHHFIEEFKQDFLEVGMTKKIDLLERLLKKTDHLLYQHIKDSEIGSLTFCHRWLILLFKREFDYENGLKLFEIISSHHIEMNTYEAKTAKDSRKWSGVKENYSIKKSKDNLDAELTFDLFVCVTVLILNRDKLFQCKDTIDFVSCTKSLIQTLSLDELLTKAEEIFYNYCQLSVIDSFENFNA